MLKSTHSKLLRIVLQSSKQYATQFTQTFTEIPIHSEMRTGAETGITIIQMNRPQTRNALSGSVIAQLHHEIKNIESDDNVRVLLVRSTVPGVFCAGADLKERMSMAPSDIPERVHLLRSLMQRFYEIPVPVIAAIDGVAFGGGLELALGCDIRVASHNAKMGLVETRLAIIPGAGGTQRLPRLINPAIARELIYTARIFDGIEAKEFGIVNHVVEQNESGDAAYVKALEIAKEILPNGPLGVRMAKLAIRKGLESNMEHGLQVEHDCYLTVIPTKDRLEGIRAFNEKRPPKFKGE